MAPFKGLDFEAGAQERPPQQFSVRKPTSSFMAAKSAL
jgi:hypothetical protein